MALGVITSVKNNCCELNHFFLFRKFACILGSVSKCLVRKCLVAKCLVQKCLDLITPRFENAQVQKCLGSLEREKCLTQIFQSYITVKIREIKKKKFSNFFHQQSATLSSTLLLETCLGWSVLTRASPRLLTMYTRVGRFSTKACFILW